MILIRYFDWFGSQEALDIERKAWVTASKEMDGIKSIKLVTSYQARYHYAWMIETDSYDNLQELNSRARKINPRDKNVLTHTPSLKYSMNYKTNFFSPGVLQMECSYLGSSFR